MKDWEILLLCLVCVIIGGMIGWACSFETYYNRGVNNTRLYYQTTGEFPTADWVKASEQHTYQYPDQIRDTLKEFTLTK